MTNALADIQRRLFNEARRLGPHHGSEVLRAVEDTLHTTSDLVRALEKAGVPINLTGLLDTLVREARTAHHYAISTLQSDNAETRIEMLLHQMRQCRRQAADIWAKARSR